MNFMKNNPKTDNPSATNSIYDQIFNWGNLSKYRDTIYGFSALWIVLYHIANIFPNRTKAFNPFIIQLIRAGNIGVDVFLILSGVCLYYSMKKSDNQSILRFYKRRFLRLFKIYLFVCIPWLLLQTALKNWDWNLFVQQITFAQASNNWFWYVYFISICYLVYPLIFKLIEKRKTWVIVVFIIAYYIFLCFLNANFKDFYLSYEIALGRVPSFLLGCVLGKLVHGKRPMKQYVILMLLTLFMFRTTITTLVIKNGLLMPFFTTIDRFFFPVSALSTIILIILFFELFKLPRLKKFFDWLGLFSLELYIVHILLRNLATAKVFLNIRPNSTTQFILYLIIFPIIAIIVSKIVQIILSCIPPNAAIGPFAKSSSPPQLSHAHHSGKTKRKQ